MHVLVHTCMCAYARQALHEILVGASEFIREDSRLLMLLSWLPEAEGAVL